MKMKNVFSLKTLSVAAVLSIALLYSCKKDNESALSSTDSENVNSESVSASVSTETADITATVVNNSNDTQLSGGRVAATQVDWMSLDGRLKGATITITPGGTFDIPQGTITIDFGTGTTDAYGVIRKGVITINYYGRRFKTGSYRTIHFTGYSRTVSATNSNTITFDNAMVYTVTNVTDSTAVPLKMHHVLENGKLTFSSDNTFIIRTSNIVVAWNKDAGTLTHLAKTQDVLHSATGTSRTGVDYTMDISKDLIHKVSCLPNVSIPVSGTKDFSVVGNIKTINYSIDFGDGACDNTAVITIGTRSITVTLSKDGN